MLFSLRPMWVWVMFLRSPLKIAPVPPAPSEVVLGFSASSVDVVFIFVARTSERLF